MVVHVLGHQSLSPFESALTQNAPVTPLESALTKNTGGGGKQQTAGACRQLRWTVLFGPAHTTKSKIPMVALIASERAHQQQRASHSFQRTPSPGPMH